MRWIKLAHGKDKRVNSKNSIKCSGIHWVVKHTNSPLFILLRINESYYEMTRGNENKSDNESDKITVEKDKSYQIRLVNTSHFRDIRPPGILEEYHTT